MSVCRITVWQFKLYILQKRVSGKTKMIYYFFLTLLHKAFADVRGLQISGKPSSLSCTRVFILIITFWLISKLLVLFYLQIAMSDQKLDNRELLNVRWAFDDPNPKARKEVNTIVCPLSPAPLPPPCAKKRMSI